MAKEERGSLRLLCTWSMRPHTEVNKIVGEEEISILSLSRSKHFPRPCQPCKPQGTEFFQLSVLTNRIVNIQYPREIIREAVLW